MGIARRARAEIRAMQAYGSARSQTGRLPVLLNANENPFDRVGGGLNRYPDPQPAALIEALALRLGTTRNRVMATRGSDEAIDLLVRVFCRAGRDSLIYCPPTFGMYAVAATIQNAVTRPVPLRAASGFDLDVGAITAALDESTKLVFLCSPNNPTGNVMSRDALQAVIEAARDRALVVVDEAYVEFAGGSVVGLLEKYDNLAVLRTLSKAWGLAGARCGVVAADPSVIDLLRRVIPPYPLPSPTVDAALVALDDAGAAAMATQVGQLAGARDALTASLLAHPCVREVFPSAANFVLIRAVDPDRMLKRAQDAGIALRDMRAQPGLDDCIRISIGSPEEMAHLDGVLDELARELV